MQISDEKGQTTVLIIVLLPVIILLLGWSVDIGRVLAVRAELFKASDIAAQEVAKEIDIREAQLSGRKSWPEMEVQAEYWVNQNLENLAGGRLTQVNVKSDERFVYVDTQARIPLIFSVLAGRREAHIRARGIGRLRKIKL